jgi:hypothetical protein
VKTIAISIAALFLSSCASTVGTYFNRDIQENRIKFKPGHSASYMGVTAARRGVIARETSASEKSSGMPNIVFCSEPPPDAAQSISAAFTAAIEKNQVGKASFADAYQTTMSNLAARTPLSETYRTAVFSICQLHLNGVLTNEETNSLFKEVTISTINALALAAGKEQNANPPMNVIESKPANAK